MWSVRILLGIVLAVFLAQTVRVLTGVGFLGFFTSVGLNAATELMFLDLVITLGLITVWMVRDARATGRRFWPFAVVTLLLGSAGPLAYLLYRTVPTQCPVPHHPSMGVRAPQA
jgi:hypothetical protein